MIANHFIYKNTTISYNDSGEGNPIVLLHGFLENKSMWDYFTPIFTQKNRVVSIDLLGHGKSDCLGYIHTMEDQAEMVFSVLSHLQINKVTLIGHSMGGYIALAFAEKYPKKLSKMVLLNATAFEDSQVRKKNRDRAIKMVKKDVVSFVRLSIANLFSDQSRDTLKKEIEFCKIEALKTPLQGIIASLEGMKIRKGRLEVLQKAKYPTLLVLSEKDSVLDYEIHKKQIETTNIILKTVSAGHMSYLENKIEVEKILLDFIN
jgi:pimeloyl-ACP methyl ester carboxylesterase